MVTQALLAAGFVETAFHCPSCGLGGTSVSRPQQLIDRSCHNCGAPVVTSVLDRFSRRAGDERPGRPGA